MVTPFYDSLLVKVTACGPSVRRRRAADGARPAGVPHPRREDEHPVPDQPGHASRSSSPAAAPPGSSTRRPSCSSSRRGRTGPRKLFDLPGRGDRQRPSAGQEAAGRTFAASRRPCRRSITSSRCPTARGRSCCELGAEKFCQWILRAEAAAAHRHHVPRRAPVAAGHAAAHATTCWRSPRPTPGCARAVLARDVGRGDVRHRDAVPEGIPLGAAGRPARADSEHPVPDAAAGVERASATRTIPTTSSRRSSRRRPQAGIDLFRIFDSLNWVPNMTVAMEAVLETGALCEAAICYTGDILDPKRHEVRPEVLRRAGQGTGEDGRAHPGHQGHGRPVQALRGRDSWSRRSSRRSAFRSTSTRTTPAACRPAAILKAAEVGLDIADGAMAPMSG